MTSQLPAFLKSPHLSSRTRQLLLDRITPEHDNMPQNLSQFAFHILTHVCEDILPQHIILGNERSVNLAFMIDRALVGPRDGWRFAELPSDLKAWEAGLMTLNAYARYFHTCDYADLSSEQRGDLLDHMHDGSLPDNVPTAHLIPAQMTFWSGDLRSEIMTIFLAHPYVQEALAVSANLTGGDAHLEGFRMENGQSDQISL